ncbi:MAG: flagellar hook assembly protein FlgD [Xanthobacteraceae bacterium]
MTTSSILPSTSTPAAASNSSALGSSAASVAQNYTTFLQMLTTQLQNQDPLNPVDSNQFTQELVMFSQVEQQLQTNSQLGTLVTLEQANQATAALSFVGKTVTFNSTTSQMTNSQASWTLNSPSPATANVIIQSSSGQTVYSGTLAMNTGNNTFNWNGQGNNGTQWPDGPYTINVSATNANGQAVSVTTQSSGVVSAVNTSTTPPSLTVGNQSYPLSQITSVS